MCLNIWGLRRYRSIVELLSFVINTKKNKETTAIALCFIKVCNCKVDEIIVFLQWCFLTFSTSNFPELVWLQPQLLVIYKTCYIVVVFIVIDL